MTEAIMYEALRTCGGVAVTGSLQGVKLISPVIGLVDDEMRRRPPGPDPRRIDDPISFSTPQGGTAHAAEAGVPIT